MNHYILFYKTVKNYVKKRKPYREAHLAVANKAFEEGILQMAGAIEEPDDEAMFIFKCKDKSIVEDFAKNDPYVQNQIVLDWQISLWNVAVGNV